MEVFFRNFSTSIKTAEMLCSWSAISKSFAHWVKWQKNICPDMISTFAAIRKPGIFKKRTSTPLVWVSMFIRALENDPKNRKETYLITSSEVSRLIITRNWITLVASINSTPVAKRRSSRRVIVSSRVELAPCLIYQSSRELRLINLYFGLKIIPIDLKASESTESCR